MDEVKEYLNKAIGVIVKHLEATDQQAREYMALELNKEKAKKAKDAKYEMRTITQLVKDAADAFPERKPAKVAKKKTGGNGLAKTYDIMPGYQTPAQDAKNKYHL
jgi:hypothetical protein